MFVLTEDVARGMRRFHASGRPINHDFANEIAARAMLRDRRMIRRSAARAKALSALRQIAAAFRAALPVIPRGRRVALMPRQRS